MTPQAWIYLVFVFALGACIGSFLNVVVYRVPAGLSLVTPGSRCGSCGHAIAWYDNIPIFSWFILRGKCRHCQARFSIRYAMVELFTAAVFAGFYYLYFIARVRGAMPGFAQGGFVIYGGHMLLLAVLIAMSLIDADHMIIDLRICRGTAVIGLALAGFWPYLMTVKPERYFELIPYASPKTAALAAGAVLGLIISHLLLRAGIIKRAYAELEQAEKQARRKKDEAALKALETMPINIYVVIGREVLFLLPILLCSWISYRLLVCNAQWQPRWQTLLAEQRWLGGMLGSVYGYCIGGGAVWLTRILGTLGFRREAMGAGDVDLMATAGAVLGWISPTFAFFLAPFAGLLWAIARLIIHHTREIPYGPFLSLATAVVMIFHDKLVDYFTGAMMPPGP